MPRHCLALDLKDDAAGIAEYKRYHEKIWPEIKDSLFAAGITDMEIYVLGTRMFMIMEVTDDYSPERKAAMDAANPKVREWEATMAVFQQDLPQAAPGEKWVPMELVFSLAAQ